MELLELTGKVLRKVNSESCAEAFRTRLLGREVCRRTEKHRRVLPGSERGGGEDSAPVDNRKKTDL